MAGVAPPGASGASNASGGTVSERQPFLEGRALVGRVMASPAPFVIEAAAEDSCSARTMMLSHMR